MEGKIGRMTGLRNFSKKIAAAERERYHGTPWAYDNEGVAEYDEHLGILFGGSISHFAAERKSRFGRLVVMDLMGHAQVLRELNVTFGIAVSLGDSREDCLRESDRRSGIELIAGDILSKKTWVRITDRTAAKSNARIDMVLCRPVGGFDRLPDDPDIMYYLISRIWDLLSENEGKFAIENPETSLPQSQVWLRKWGVALKTGGVDFFKASTGISFTKTPDSPKVLPKIDIK